MLLRAMPKLNFSLLPLLVVCRYPQFLSANSRVVVSFVVTKDSCFLCEEGGKNWMLFGNCRCFFLLIFFSFGYAIGTNNNTAFLWKRRRRRDNIFFALSPPPPPPFLSRYKKICGGGGEGMRVVNPPRIPYTILSPQGLQTTLSSPGFF